MLLSVIPVPAICLTPGFDLYPHFAGSSLRFRNQKSGSVPDRSGRRIYPPPVFPGRCTPKQRPLIPVYVNRFPPDSLPGYDKKPDAQNQRVSHLFLSPGIAIPGKAAAPDRIQFGICLIEHGVTSHQPYASGDGSVPCPPWMGGTGNRDDSFENRMTSDLTRQMAQRRGLARLFRRIRSAQTAETPGAVSFR